MIKSLVGNLDLGFWILQRMHSECILLAGFKIQDSRFLGTLWRQILNPPPGFKICPKESPEILNLESWILDSRFAPKSPQKSWILNPGFKICPKESPEILILNLESGFKICSKESPEILNLESWILPKECILNAIFARFKIQDPRFPRGLDSRLESSMYIYIYVYIHYITSPNPGIPKLHTKNRQILL